MLNKISIQFQGGFAGKTTKLIDLDRKTDICPLYPKDNNKLQEFVLPKHEQTVARRRIKIQFMSSTDFYGRIIVYTLDFHGSVAEQSGTTLENLQQQEPAAATLESASTDISGTIIKIE
ncbi:Nuclear receptor 2C2-associated protein [Coemansia sp. RSA 1365]|nr:Nuclear receptor 2C2-associated protein [Coemansia sp. RSA 1365]